MKIKLKTALVGANFNLPADTVLETDSANNPLSLADMQRLVSAAQAELLTNNAETASTPPARTAALKTGRKPRKAAKPQT